jgi:hypothetical protein
VTASNYRPNIKRLTSAEFARPANATQYTAGDVVGPVTTPAVQTFALASKYSSGGLEIVEARLSKSTNVTTLATFRVNIYNAAPTAIADNLAWSYLYADREKFIGYIDLDIMVSDGASAGAVGQMAATRLPLVASTASGTASLYAVITAVGGYTPGSAETFALSLTVRQF